MMNEAHNPSRRSLLVGMAAAPAVLALGATTATAAMPAADAGEWSRLLANYYRLRDADEADQKHGALRRANDAHNALFPGKPRASYRDDPRFDASLAAVHQAEQAHLSAFDRPRWAAYDALLACPAPTLAALLVKIAVAEVEEEGCEPESGPYIHADIRRLAVREA